MSKETDWAVVTQNAKLIDIIRRYGPLDKTATAKYMNTSWPTISKTIDALERQELIQYLRDSEADGKKTDKIEVQADVGCFWGISMGSSQIKISVISFSFSLFDAAAFSSLLNKSGAFKKYPPLAGQNYICLSTPDNWFEFQTTIDYLLEQIININEWSRTGPESAKYRVLGIGFAFTGAVDNVKRILIKSHNIEYLQDINFDSIILQNRSKYLDENQIQVSFDHNAKASIIAEKYSLFDPNNPNRKYQDKKNIACIYLGTGIGAGFILNNKLYRGTSNTCGELGHIPVSPCSEKRDADSDSCSCGSTNCLEYAIRKKVFCKTLDEFKKMGEEEMRECLSAPMADSKRKFDLLGEYIGFAMNTVINLFNLDLIIFTGRLSKFMDELWRPLNNKKLENRLGYTRNDCSLAESTNGLLAPAIGIAIEAYFDRFKAEIEWDA